VKRRIRISSAAWSQIDRASTWWRKHRDKAPDAFDDDLEKAFDEIRSSPNIGKPVRARRTGVRTVGLERTGHLLYYRLIDGVVVILALWHASRRSRPKL
jgi:plasmid stabilization system protein ParE